MKLIQESSYYHTMNIFFSQIPNLLGLFRILATPLLMWLIMTEQPHFYLWAALLLLVMSVSDMLDGYLARKLNVVSPLGIFLDTISDKIFVTGTLLPMIECGLLSGWIALIIIVREFLVSGLRSYAASLGTVISAGKWGKQKLVITVVALIWRLIAASVEADNRQYFAVNDTFYFLANLWPIAMAMAVIWTIFSGVDYLKKAWPLLLVTQTPAASSKAPTPDSASPTTPSTGKKIRP